MTTQLLKEKKQRGNTAVFFLLLVGIVILVILFGKAFVDFVSHNTILQVATKADPKKSSKQPIGVQKPHISDQVMNYFLEIVIGSEYGGKNDIVTRWVEPKVLVKVYGHPDVTFSTCLEQTIADFNALSTSTKLILTQVAEDIDIHVVPEREFSAIEPHYVPVNEGFFWSSWNEKGEIQSARILIDSERVTSQERCHLIREELTQSMGFRRDSTLYADSIFYGPWTATTAYSDLDKEVIRMIYRYGLRAGMTREDVRSFFSP